MFMSVVAGGQVAGGIGVGVYPELAGSRVMVTGLKAALGVDLVRAFADHKSHLVVQADEDTPEIAEVGALVTQTAASVKLFTEPLATGDDAIRFCQRETATAGGLDTLVNLVAIDRREAGRCRSLDDVESLVSSKLIGATLMTRVAANRMRLTLGTGLVLNVVRMSTPITDAEKAVAGIVRAALAAMTRAEAKQWADQAIRINAVGPGAIDGSGSGCLASEPDIAALALYLSSKKGRQLSGHVFDAEGVASNGC